MTLTCPKCKSQHIAKKGFRHNNLSKKQKYQCTKCKSWFVEDDGFKRMRHKPEDIVRAVHMHNEGMSLFKTKDHIWQHDGVKVTRWTISQWTKKYSIFFGSSSSSRKAKA